MKALRDLARYQARSGVDANIGNDAGAVLTVLRIRAHRHQPQVMLVKSLARGAHQAVGLAPGIRVYIGNLQAYGRQRSLVILMDALESHNHDAGFQLAHVKIGANEVVVLEYYVVARWGSIH